MSEQLIQIDKKELRRLMDKQGISKHGMMDKLGIKSETTWWRHWKNGYSKMAILAMCYELKTNPGRLTND